MPSFATIVKKRADINRVDKEKRLAVAEFMNPQISTTTSFPDVLNFRDPEKIRGTLENGY
jgi:hypothetical protein